MKHLFSLIAMLVIGTISANAQNVVAYINGQRYDLNATTTYNIGNGATATGQELAQAYPMMPQQQPMQLPAAAGNYQQSQMQDAANQLALENRALQNEVLKEQLRASRNARAQNWATFGVNTLVSGFGVYNSTRQTTGNLRLMNTQGNYLENIINSAGCCGGSNPGVTPPIVGGTNPIYYPPGVTVFYDNRDGNGPFYVLNGQRVYTVPPQGTPINYGYSGQTPTNNGWNSSFGFPNSGGNPAYNQQQISYTQRSIDQMYFTGNMNPGH